MPLWPAASSQVNAGRVAAMTESTAVIVPVMGRPHHADPFMESLRASTDDAVAYAIGEAHEQGVIDAWVRAGAQVFTGPAHSFAEKVNLGHQLTREPWLFIVGSDVVFHDGWLKQAHAVAWATGARVIGTNDLGNKLVMAGDHGTHLLIARNYVDEVGASWDGPGVVCHEGYRHWYVDDEIVTAAKQREVWASARMSVVEHLHPVFLKAKHDEVYAYGQSFKAQDEALHVDRRARYAR
jgi:hypothetical protein